MYVLATEARAQNMYVHGCYLTYILIVRMYVRSQILHGMTVELATLSPQEHINAHSIGQECSDGASD